METVFYKRATFVSHLPAPYLYTHSHCWLGRVEGDRWRVGYTKFALRMLGEIVDVQFDCQAGAPVSPGQVIGTIEGFKALSDIFCVGSGKFTGANPDLKQSLEALADSPYDKGWLYEFTGSPDSRATDVKGYFNLLDATIDRMLQKEQESKGTSE